MVRRFLRVYPVFLVVACSSLLCMEDLGKAIGRHDIAFIQELIAKDPQIIYQKLCGATPLQMAILANFTDGVKVLLEAIPDNLRLDYICHQECVDIRAFCAEVPILPFVAACGGTDLVRLLVGAIPEGARQGYVNKQYDGMTALHQVLRWNLHKAFREALIEVLRILISHGACVMQRGCMGWSALHFAARFADADAVQLLIDTLSGEERKDFVNQKNDEEQIPLHLVSNVDIARLLIAEGSSLDQQDSVKRSPLHYAVALSWPNKTSIVRVLIDSIPDDKRVDFVSMKDDNGRTALHTAAECGNQEIVHILIDAIPEALQGYYIGQQDNDGFTALHLADFNGHTRIVLELLQIIPKQMRECFDEQQDECGWISLYLANHDSFAAIVKKILDDAKGDEGLALVIQQLQGRSPLHEVVLSGRADVVHMLIKAIPDDKRFAFLSQKDASGGMALNYAVSRGSIDITQTLVNAIPEHLRPIYVNKQDNDGNTSLHSLASQFESGKPTVYEKIVRILIAAGAGLNIKNINGNNPLEEAIMGDCEEGNKAAAEEMFRCRQKIQQERLQARQKTPIIAHAMAQAYHPRLGMASPVSLVPQSLLHDIMPLIIQANEQHAECLARQSFLN